MGPLPLAAAMVELVKGEVGRGMGWGGGCFYLRGFHVGIPSMFGQ